MRSLFHSNRIVLALCVNAALLLLILISVATRQGRAMAGSQEVTTAETQPKPPTAAPSGGTLTVMPGQLSPNHWGCYVMDPQNQTLCVYQFDPISTELRLAAARDIQYDRLTKYYNTTPPPAEIKANIERSALPARAAPTTNRAPE